MFDFVASPKVKMINVRLTPEIHEDFKMACFLRGVSMSSFLHQTVVKTIREEKEREPQAFDKPVRGIPYTGKAKTPDETRERKAK